MQRNKSNEIARDVIRTAKETFNERINNITLFNLTDEPYKMFSIKCTIYNYFVLVDVYKRQGQYGAVNRCGNFSCTGSFRTITHDPGKGGDGIRQRIFNLFVGPAQHISDRRTAGTGCAHRAAVCGKLAQLAFLVNGCQVAEDQSP